MDLQSMQTAAKTMLAAAHAEPGGTLRQDASLGTDTLTAQLSSCTKQSLPAIDRLLGSPAWQRELGERIQWMTHKSLQAAELRVNPPHLGALEIRVFLSQDQASIQFSSQHAAVREAIESAIPKLREMLGAQHIHLADVNVSQQHPSHQNESRDGNPHFNRQSGSQPVEKTPSASEEEEDASMQTSVSPLGERSLNLYA
jgi:flagellar hook-length control protein FliK